MLLSLLLCYLPQSAPSAGHFTDEFGESLARVEHKGSKEPDWVAVGSPYTLGGKGSSAVYCFGGSRHELRWTAKGRSFYSYRLAEVGDIDGDSVTDLLTNDDGEIVVLSGAKGTSLDSLPAVGRHRCGPLASLQGRDGMCIVTGLSGPKPGARTGVTCISFHSKQELWTFEGSDLVHLDLTCVIPISDVDQDGMTDVLLGYGETTVTNFRKQAERVVCLSGASGKQLFQVCGSAGDRLGYSLAECGDWNGDGIPDFAAGAPRLDVRNNSIVETAGYVLICSGSDGSALRRLEPGPLSANFGYSLASVPDRNGGGRRRFLATAYVNLGEGDLYVCWPGENSPQRLCRKEPEGEFGYLVRSIGDQDGDGRDDCAVSKTPESIDCDRDGSVTLVSGRDGKELCVLRRPAN